MNPRPLIAFITSFRGRALAQDWDYHVLLLERAVLSMLAQRHGECCVVVACHEIPDTPLAQEPRVHFLPVNFPLPTRNNDDMCVDKVLKLSAGAEWARAQGCEYVVFTDADDLVSNRIAGFVADHRGENGWYCPSEMFYTYGGRFMRLFDIPAPCAGPCVIVRANLLQFTKPPFYGAWTELIIAGGESTYLRLLGRHDEMVNTLAAVGLGHYREYMSNEGYPLNALPFPGNVIINHRDSTSFVAGGLGSYEAMGFQRAVKRCLRFLPSVRLMTRSLRREFLIPSKEEIPLRYRNGDSIFWR